MSVRLAIYPGSFDPPTHGHIDVVERAAKLFDRLIVSVGVNSSKSPLLNLDLRLEVLRKCVEDLPNVEIDSFDGLLIDHARRHGAAAIVRGLRATGDFEYEFQLAMVNRRLGESVETVFLATKWEYSYLSSSIVREVALLGGDYSGLVPRPVAETLENVLASRARGDKG